MDIRPFLPVDIELMDIQAKQSPGVKFLTEEQAEQLAELDSWTGWIGWEPIICAGTVPIWLGRYAAWAYLSRRAQRHMPAIHRAVKRYLDEFDGRRLEIAVACDFAAGHRWARMLGFEMEAERMRAYSPLGEDHALYVRVR